MQQQFSEFACLPSSRCKLTIIINLETANVFLVPQLMFQFRVKTTSAGDFPLISATVIKANNFVIGIYSIACHIIQWKAFVYWDQLNQQTTGEMNVIFFTFPKTREQKNSS
jgi:hypothetical protein